jgi:hypothetical protein
MRLRDLAQSWIVPRFAWAICVLTLLVAAQAKAERRNLAVIRDTEAAIKPELVAAVDAALLEGLAEIAGIQDPLVSPVTYAEVQLSVGCEDESVGCLTSIARAADVEAVVVRQLHASGETVQLRLLYFKEAAGQPPFWEERSGAQDAPAELIREVPDMLRRLLGVTVAGADAPNAPSARAVRTSSPRAAEPSVRPLTWVALAAGASLLTPGIVLALSADADYDDFRSRTIDTRADVDRAHDDFDSIETRAAVSQVLIPAGAVALAAGAVLLGFDLTAEPEPKRDARARLFAVPLARGGVIGVRGALDGAR